MTDMTVAEVAEACGVTERTVRRWLSEGRLPGLKIGGRVHIPARSVRELRAPYMASDGASVPPDLAVSLEGAMAARERRIARAERLLAQVRSLATAASEPAGAVALVRAGRDDPRSLT